MLSKYLMQKMHPNAIEIYYDEANKYNDLLYQKVALQM